MGRRAQLLLLGAAVALAAAFAVVATVAGPSGHSDSSPQVSAGATSTSGFDGAALPAGVSAADFTLTDRRGRAVSLSDYRGHVVVLAFPYSSCGATCVVIAQQIRGALDELARPAAVLFVSADPAADTPARVSRFLSQVSLSGRVVYLSGPASKLRAVWREYRVAPASAGRTAFDRSASVLLIDGLGHERVVFDLEQLTPESLAHDIRTLEGG